MIAMMMMMMMMMIANKGSVRTGWLIARGPVINPAGCRHDRVDGVCSLLARCRHDRVDAPFQFSTRCRHDIIIPTTYKLGLISV